MIQPEPNWAADLSGLQPGKAATNVPLPAAGRLGMIEELCGGAHWALKYATNYRCVCGATL